MNASTKALQTGYIFGVKQQAVASYRSWSVMALMAILIVSTFCLIYVKSVHRQVFVELAMEQQSIQQIHVNWSRLLLERSTLTAPSHVQMVAKDMLDMTIPKIERVLVVE